MTQFFTYCWQHREALRHPGGEPVGVAYGSQFARRGMLPGDQVYIVSVRQGRVHLLGKMLVRAVTHSADDFRRLAGSEPVPASEYLVAGSCTPARLVQLPDELTRGLRFLRGSRLEGLSFREGSLVDGQSLRGVRRLSAESAAALDGLLPPLMPFRRGSPTVPELGVLAGPVPAMLTLRNPRRPDLGPVEVDAVADPKCAHLRIPPHVRTQLGLEVVARREVTLPDGGRRPVPYVGPVELRYKDLVGFAGALVLGDEVLLGAIPMQDMDLVVIPGTRAVDAKPGGANVAIPAVK